MSDVTGEVSEPVLEPDLPIIDAHHHLWAHTGHRYLIEEYAADTLSGHNILASVYVECGAMLRPSGPPALRVVGEAEFAGGMAAMSESGLYGPTRICAGIVGGAELVLGDAVEPVLEALAAASGGRLRGIRNAANWDADPAVNTGTRPSAPEGLLRDARFRAGFSRLARHGLLYDALVYHPQLLDVCDLADAFPNTTIIVNHCGGLLGLQGYARQETYSQWRSLVGEVARRPNMLMKLGGLSARRCGFGFDQRPVPATAAELATTWMPYIAACIELFGTQRCMFESNFPPDRVSGSYRRLWNAFKMITQGCSAAEKAALYCDTAQSVYRIAAQAAE
ncbi:amidohydrolase family protein [Muricoccus pecuniae]|uniref:Putative TIM-barrel fold metal-dependent hydrolase n=1 Tax=Muricoccus pecuniae TaxID=693023 RepID=A0A840YIC3_9PROT|nr:amidohydrolase family protein [Roseomonas pecuniae]MBB5696241.1 putative TIM-barrel fold metal-dependent hydrolase [Roseomonas pecuniae]